MCGVVTAGRNVIRNAFGHDATRADGLRVHCRECRSKKYREGVRAKTAPNSPLTSLESEV
jgi:hypothetical protein